MGPSCLLIDIHNLPKSQSMRSKELAAWLPIVVATCWRDQKLCSRLPVYS